MRTDVVRLYRTIHTWTGITTGLILFVAFYAGALTMFKEPLDRWVAPPEPPSLIGLERGAELIAGTLAQRPDAAKDFTLTLGASPADGAGEPLRLTWRSSRADTMPWSASVAPDGSVAVERLNPAGLGQLVDLVHRTVGVPGDLDIGTAVTGVASALYVVALVSGVIVLLPSLVKDFFALRVGRNIKRMWLDVHNVLGILSLPFHVVIALSAVVFGLHDQFYDALDHLVYEGRMRTVIEASSPLRAVKRDPQPAVMLPPDALLARAADAAPGFTPRRLQYQQAGTGSALVRVWGEDPRYLVRREGFLVLSAIDGRILDTEYMPGHQGPWSATVSAFFALHFGSFGGGIVRWTYFVLGLAGAFLFYTGNLLWIESRRRADSRTSGAGAGQSRPIRLMAAGTVGVCFGSVAGLSLTIAAGRWLHGAVADLNAWHWAVYYAAFLGACCWAFTRGAGRAGVELAWAASAATLAIPLTTLLAPVLPALAPWRSIGATGLGVDLVALAGAVLLARIATVAARKTAVSASLIPSVGR